MAGATSAALGSAPTKIINVMPHAQMYMPLFEGSNSAALLIASMAGVNAGYRFIQQP